MTRLHYVHPADYTRGDDRYSPMDGEEEASTWLAVPDGGIPRLRGAATHRNERTNRFQNRSPNGWRRPRKSVVLRVVNLAAAACAVIAGMGMFAGPGLGGAGRASAAESGTVQTKWGPLTALDRELLVRVRQAGLWERPTGLQAQQRAGSQRVKDVGKVLAADHLMLDVKVRQVAAQLGVPLPNKPNVDQQSWMKELSTLTGAAYDRTFANRLRAAHGKVFAVVAAVRANTQNSVIRAFAEIGVQYVMKHMHLLESTGLVSPADMTVTTVATAVATTTVSSATEQQKRILLPAATGVALALIVNLMVVSRRSWN